MEHTKESIEKKNNSIISYLNEKFWVKNDENTIQILTFASNFYR